MADRTRTVLDDVRFMKGVLLMTDFAFAIDRIHGDAIVKTVSQSFAKACASRRSLVAFCAIVGEFGMRGRDFARVEKSFATVIAEEKDRDQSAKDRQQTNDEPRTPPGVKAAVVTEIAFVALGDLFLRARQFRHRLNI